MSERIEDWGLAPDIGQCRLCGATEAQRHFWPEVYAGSGQQLRRCGYCAAVYLAPGFTEAGLARFYAGPYRRLFPAEVPWNSISRFFAWRGDVEVARQRLSLIAPRLPRNGHLFEMGSGFGAFLGQAAALREDLQLSASEPDLSHRGTLLDQAKVDFVDALANLPDNSLDGIVAFHVLEHLIDPRGFLEQAASALRTGGQLWIEVPDLMADWRTRLFVHPAHLSYFSADNLRRLAEAAGLEVLYCGPHTLPSLDGTLWLEARRPERLAGSPMAPADAMSVNTIDRWIERVGWGWKDRIKVQAKRVALALLGPGLVGELQRWRQHRGSREKSPR
ncbi:class I SAM-dependent methyltransferase [Pseudomonas sp. PDM16]|uniref:class I SAM-dependent methyltransferase n=1 Tax=Pseudomonas sp. PDM16 TaxID=2769292 RepID=UPI00177E38FA|nr:class I SAM-dependent methyltransferase [Pseudomonas sp. PDM16]MBD9415038.1 class I SAM-dependent methyltransferase [Pseudomonas sp. PDM16]